MVNDRLIFYQENILKFADFIKSVYKQEQISYPKFYKMDVISKLGFLAAELVLKETTVDGYLPEAVGVVMSNSSSSLDTDYDYQELIRDKSNYFPSPSVFVYTLPNILIGEICIRHRIKGETAFFVSEKFDPEHLGLYVTHLFDQGKITACICGWIEVFKENYHSVLFTVEKIEEKVEDRDYNAGSLFNVDNIYKLYKN